MYLDLYVCTVELREEVSLLLNSSLKYIAKWIFVARLFCDNQLFNNPQISVYLNMQSLFEEFESVKEQLKAEKTSLYSDCFSDLAWTFLASVSLSELNFKRNEINKFHWNIV